jgi:hypothetical protein
MAVNATSHVIGKGATDSEVHRPQALVIEQNRVPEIAFMCSNKSCFGEGGQGRNILGEVVTARLVSRPRGVADAVRVARPGKVCPCGYKLIRQVLLLLV